MTAKGFTNDGSNLSLLIIPVAVGIILISSAWPLLLLLLAVLVAWKIYDKVQWLNQCDKFNTLFNQLIKENKGCLTVLDFSYKTNLSDRSAKNFLERKAQEYGAVRKNVGKEGIVYYFITASALGSIFDDSEAIEEDLMITPSVSVSPTTNVLNELAQLKKNQVSVVETPITEVETVEIETPITEEETVEIETPIVTEVETQTPQHNQQLIQSELAKRLDINSSTIGKRKLEPDFTQWSQSKDPEGIAWVYDQSTKVFIAKTD